MLGSRVPKGTQHFFGNSTLQLEFPDGNPAKNAGNLTYPEGIQVKAMNSTIIFLQIVPVIIFEKKQSVFGFLHHVFVDKSCQCQNQNKQTVRLNW